MKQHTKTDFSWIKLSPAKYMLRAKAALAAKKQVIEKVKNIPAAERTFENTLAALEFAGQELAAQWGWLELLTNTKPDEKSRQQAKSASDFLQEAVIELEYDEGIYQALKELQARQLKLSGPDKKLFIETMRDYKRMGFELPKQQRNKVKKYFQQLAKLGSDFRQNINDYQDFIVVSNDELAGLPENYIAGLAKDGSGYKVSLDYPDYVPFMQQAHSGAKREELGRKYLRKGGAKNISVLKKMISTREAVARLLGYKSHAAYVLEVKMAKSPEQVKAFLERLVKPLRSKVKKELSHLSNLKQQLKNDETNQLGYFDISYLITQDQKKRFNVDRELVRQYFPLDIVTQGMFRIYQQLLSVKFEPAFDVPVWHKEVRAYKVFDKATKKHLAYFFLDLFPRPGKYGHAAVFPIVPGLRLPNGEYQKPVAAMVANFPKPNKKHPSLLSHNEVETYFHEFGHVVHGVLTQAKYGSQSGTSVQRDFVEAPSQMLENWMWDAKMLNMLSGHYKNRKHKLPKQLLTDMIAAKYHMVAYDSMRQLIFGTFDIMLHADKPVRDPVLLYAQLVRDLIGLSMPKDQLFPAGFGHLEGYDAGYYGYLWSKVYAADMFTRFEKEGLLDERAGSDYRKYILEPGSSEDALHLITKFLGRKPNNKAFLKEIGVNK